MMKFSKGFTIFEVLIAVFILVSSVFVLSDLQIRSSFRVLRDREYIDRVFLVKKDFYHTLIQIPKVGKTQVTSIEDPDIKVTTVAEEIGKKSALKEMKEKLLMVRSEGVWESGPHTRKLTMLGYLIKPDEEKES